MLKKFLIVLLLGAAFIVGFSVAQYIISQKPSYLNTKEIIAPIVKEVSTARPKYNPQPLSLEKIFQADHTWVATLSAERVRVLIATGDVIPARSVNFQTVKRGNFKWPFLKTAEVLRNADITLINLESPLIPDCPLTNEGMIFCGDPRHLEGLTHAGVDIVNLANNHLENYGEEGIKTTIDLLDVALIQYTGAMKSAYKEVRGTRFAFLGYSEVGYKEPLISWADEEKIVSEIKKAKEKADIIIVSFHWGVEYTEPPTKRQRELADLAIDSGADLIIGNHPHWVQPIEIYQGKLITYAHGNFIFDQMWSEKTRQGVVGHYTFYDDKLIDAQFLPILIEDYGQPHFLELEEKRQILETMKTASLKLTL